MRVTEVSDYYGSNASHYGIRGIVLRSFTTQTLPWNDLNLYVLFGVHKVANVSRGVCIVYLFGRLFCICMHNYQLSLTLSEPIICLYAVGGFTRDTMSYHGLVPCRMWR